MGFSAAQGGVCHRDLILHRLQVRHVQEDHSLSARVIPDLVEISLTAPYPFDPPTTLFELERAENPCLHRALPPRCQRGVTPDYQLSDHAGAKNKLNNRSERARRG